MYAIVYIHTYIHYITLHYITLHYIKLHYITLHYITLHYITLHYITYIHTYINVYKYICTNIYIYTYKNTYKYNYVIFASMHPVMVLYLIQSTLTFDSSGIHQICLTPAWHGLPLKKLQAKDCFLMSEIEEFLLKHVSRISTHNTSLGLFPRMFRSTKEFCQRATSFIIPTWSIHFEKKTIENTFRPIHPQHSWRKKPYL